MFNTYISILQNNELDIVKKKGVKEIKYEFPINNKVQLYGMICKYFYKVKEERKTFQFSRCQIIEDKIWTAYKMYIQKLKK